MKLNKLNIRDEEGNPLPDEDDDMNYQLKSRNFKIL